MKTALIGARLWLLTKLKQYYIYILRAMYLNTFRVERELKHKTHTHCNHNFFAMKEIMFCLTIL